MKSLASLASQYRQALLFLTRFVGFYLLLNTLYGLYIESFMPTADPFTSLFSNQIGSTLSLFHKSIGVIQPNLSPHISINLNGKTIISIFEGCNGINVLIVYFVFLHAFTSKWYLQWRFLVASIIAIYATNVARVLMLFWVALYFPSSLYFFHKFFFTALIYGAVFILWYLWVVRVRSYEQRVNPS